MGTKSSDGNGRRGRAVNTAATTTIQDLIQEIVEQLKEPTLDEANKTPVAIWKKLFKDVGQLGLDAYGTVDQGPLGMLADLGSAAIQFPIGNGWTLAFPLSQ